MGVTARYRALLDWLLTLDLPNVYLSHRENRGRDTCAFRLALNSILGLPPYHVGPDGRVRGDPHGFTHVFILNSSVRGPFLPLYYSEPWYWPFLQPLLVAPEAGSLLAASLAGRRASMVGSYGSCEQQAHLQSMSLMLGVRDLNELMDLIDCFDQDTYARAVGSEIGISQRLLEHQTALVPLLYGLAGHALGSDPECNAKLNPHVAGRYFGGDTTPHDVVFVKNSGEMQRQGLLADSVAHQTELYTCKNQVEI